MSMLSLRFVTLANMFKTVTLSLFLCQAAVKTEGSAGAKEATGLELLFFAEKHAVLKSNAEKRR